MNLVTHDIASALEPLLPDNADEPVFVLTDSNTARLCLPLVQRGRLVSAHIITIESGDENKNLATLTHIWQALVDGGATRHSLLINLGGGMVTDVGGLAASTFKRGIRFVNVPTTLLGVVDAATGGKTGINFCGLKNEIGSFAQPEAVIIDSHFFQTLDEKSLLSGYAEMLKHALISDSDLLRDTVALVSEDSSDEPLKDLITKRLASSDLIARNLAVKERIIAADPTEHGLRKVLNFGHTFGHAFESLSHTMGSPLPHGFAVMWGMVCELYLSCRLLGLNKTILTDFLYLAKENYGAFPFSCKNYDALLALMHHDKKNEAQNINFTLLAAVGQPKIDQTAPHDLLLEALDFVREN